MRHDLKGSFNDESGNIDPTSAIIPSVVRDNAKGGRVVQDVYSSLLDENVIFIRGVVESNMADTIIASMFHLYYDKMKSTLEAAKSAGTPIEDIPASQRTIKFLINSPGGVIDDGLQIYDMMQLLKSEGVIIETHVTGKAMSMGSILLVAGSDGYRHAWPSANIMLHDASGGSQGKRADMGIRQEEIDYISERMKDIYRTHTDMTEEDLETIFTKGDYFMRAEEAKELGIIDKALYPVNDPVVAEMLKRQNDRHQDGEVEPTKPKRIRVRRDDGPSPE
jgi:ATP-dependent Clp protease protease subunit